MARHDDEDETFLYEDTAYAELCNHIRRYFVNDRDDFTHSGFFLDRECIKVTAAKPVQNATPLAALFGNPVFLGAGRFIVYTLDRDSDEEGSVKKFLITVAEQKI